MHLTLIDGPSAEPATVRRVEEALGGNPIDLLFIDGDHAYEGVKSDFLTYRHFVREGGVVAFHDIMRDGQAQGIEDFYSGGVPDLWAALRTQYPSQEFVENRDQLGFGIGLLRYSSSVEPRGAP